MPIDTLLPPLENSEPVPGWSGPETYLGYWPSISDAQAAVLAGVDSIVRNPLLTTIAPVISDSSEDVNANAKKRSTNNPQTTSSVTTSSDSSIGRPEEVIWFADSDDQSDIMKCLQESSVKSKEASLRSRRSFQMPSSKQADPPGRRIDDVSKKAKQREGTNKANTYRSLYKTRTTNSSCKTKTPESSIKTKTPKGSINAATQESFTKAATPDSSNWIEGLIPSLYFDNAKPDDTLSSLSSNSSSQEKPATLVLAAPSVEYGNGHACHEVNKLETVPTENASALDRLFCYVSDFKIYNPDDGSAKKSKRNTFAHLESRLPMVTNSAFTKFRDAPSLLSYEEENNQPKSPPKWKLPLATPRPKGSSRFRGSKSFEKATYSAVDSKATVHEDIEKRAEPAPTGRKFYKKREPRVDKSSRRPWELISRFSPHREKKSTHSRLKEHEIVFSQDEIIGPIDLGKSTSSELTIDSPLQRVATPPPAPILFEAHTDRHWGPERHRYESRRTSNHHDCYTHNGETEHRRTNPSPRILRPTSTKPRSSSTPRRSVNRLSLELGKQSAHNKAVDKRVMHQPRDPFTAGISRGSGFFSNADDDSEEPNENELPSIEIPRVMSSNRRTDRIKHPKYARTVSKLRSSIHSRTSTPLRDDLPKGEDRLHEHRHDNTTTTTTTANNNNTNKNTNNTNNNNSRRSQRSSLRIGDRTYMKMAASSDVSLESMTMLRANRTCSSSSEEEGSDDRQIRTKPSRRMERMKLVRHSVRKRSITVAVP